VSLISSVPFQSAGVWHWVRAARLVFLLGQLKPAQVPPWEAFSLKKARIALPLVAEGEGVVCRFVGRV